MTSQSPKNAAQRTITPAATVIVFRDSGGHAPELLMLERAAGMRFAGGASAFPGGRIDPPDRLLAQTNAPHLAPDDGAARVAAVRETLEETGLLLGVSGTVTAERAEAARIMLAHCGELAPVLDAFDLTLDLDQLVPFARWCPPWGRAFDTRFFLANLGTGDVSIVEDGTETNRLYWSSAADTLALVEQGAVSVLLPTLCNLERLAGLGSFADARQHALALPPRLIEPWLEESDGRRVHCIPEDAGYPVCRHTVDDAAHRTT